ncbi:hypothetical protein LXA43DRAFT_1061398 [Ganoderma leucocontextum]|nr:hypothetical protein LXA43DRAFT_1061398 [Ganoderma leucocontextum]
MNPFAYSSVHTATNAYSSTSASACSGAIPSSSYLYADYASDLYEDPSSSAEGWSGEYIELGVYSDADRALFEAFVAAEVSSTSSSGPCTLVPMQSPPFYDQDPGFVHHPTEAIQLPRQSLDVSHLHPHATAPFKSTVSPVFEQAPPKTTTSCISPDLIYPPLLYDHDPKINDSAAATSQSSRARLRAAHRSPSSTPYPSPSPEPSPRTSSIVVASQRRNAPAHSATPAPAKSWQCPYCPYIQRNRRSPDLKRHIKTHTRGADVADWVCCGVPVLNAIELGVPAATVREAQVFDFDGIMMIRGCRKAFSRRDALIRHLQREKGKCFGDALSLHQRGNRESS